MGLIGFILIIVGIILVFLDAVIRPPRSPWLLHVGVIVGFIGVLLGPTIPGM